MKKCYNLSMKTVFCDQIYQYEIEKSKFIGVLFHASTKEEFKDKLEQIKKDYPKATHYCYAYSINKQNKNNDDGEPSGTAGNPIMENILRNELNDIGLVVIRYFGGIKLGAGGLTRAYNKCASETINNAKIIEQVITKQYELTYDYSLNNIVESYIKKIDIQTMSIQYNEQINRVIATNKDINELVNICLGKITIKQIKDTIINFEI